MKIVMDTNILFISIPKKSKYRIIFDCFLSKEFTLVISNDILSEYAEIIAKKTNLIVATNILEMLLSAENVKKQEVYFKWQLIEIDKDDNKFVDCSIAGNADYLITNDKHFDVLKSVEFPLVTILNIDEFLDLLIIKN